MHTKERLWPLLEIRLDLRGIGFDLWGLIFFTRKIHRLKPMLLKTR